MLPGDIVIADSGPMWIMGRAAGLTFWPPHARYEVRRSYCREYFKIGITGIRCCMCFVHELSDCAGMCSFRFCRDRLKYWWRLRKWSGAWEGVLQFILSGQYIFWLYCLLWFLVTWVGLWDRFVDRIISFNHLWFPSLPASSCLL